MMTASSTEFISSLFTQTGGFIENLLPLFYLGFSLIMSLFVISIIYKVFKVGFKKVLK